MVHSTPFAWPASFSRQARATFEPFPTIFASPLDLGLSQPNRPDDQRRQTGFGIESLAALSTAPAAATLPSASGGFHASERRASEQAWRRKASSDANQTRFRYSVA